MDTKRTTILTTCFTLASAGVLMTVMPGVEGVVQADPQQGTEVVYLTGTVRDFTQGHADFSVTDASVTGHFAFNVGTQLGGDGRPSFGGGGQKILTQWFDKDTNPIMPYLGANEPDDPGLPGGHFDVDVFDSASTNEMYHEHQYDDKFDVTYVDLVNDSRLLLWDVLGADYPNNLRLEILNAHHGSGTFTFQAGTNSLNGNTQGWGGDVVFAPGELTQLRFDFVSLNDLRGTEPHTVQGDIVDRDDSLSIRLYDDTTNALVYELAVYHHVQGGGGGGGGGADGANELEFCACNMIVNEGDTFNIRDYVHMKDGSPVNWSDCYFTYTDGGAENQTTPAGWHLAEFNAGQSITITDADDDHGTGNVGKGKYRIYIMLNGATETDDHMTIKVDNHKDSEVEEAKCDDSGGGGGTTDACGDAINDNAGSFGGVGNGAITSSDSFGEWFRDIGGVNLSMSHLIGLQRNDQGVYEYLTDAFYPIDGLLLENESDNHNNNFTYTLATEFSYDSCTAQFFEFEGNDDCWVFINGQMVIDLGGANTPSRQFVALDRLGLVDGQNYTLNFFYAQRRDTLDSVFRLRTNILFAAGNPPTVSLGYD